ncbi:MAG: SBBP repeat-containing protein, partial [Opitutae bacterium]
TQQLGNSSSSNAKAVATDSSDNIYVAGSTSGGLDGNSSAGSQDIIVVKYDSSGAKQWTQQLGTSSSEGANAIATDSSGNVYIAGLTKGGLDGNSSAGDGDIFVVKYDSDGNKQ